MHVLAFQKTHLTHLTHQSPPAGPKSSNVKRGSMLSPKRPGETQRGERHDWLMALDRFGFISWGMATWHDSAESFSHLPKGWQEASSWRTHWKNEEKRVPRFSGEFLLGMFKVSSSFQNYWAKGVNAPLLSHCSLKSSALSNVSHHSKRP